MPLLAKKNVAFTFSKPLQTLFYCRNVGTSQIFKGLKRNLTTMRAFKY